ncbi:MAG: ABC transporter substrate-binding protein, partial [Actinomycetota bacterium]
TKIQFIPCDDEANDTRSTTCAKKLVEEDGIFAMGPSFTPFSFTVTGQLEKQGVPWVGYDGINVEGFSANNVVTVGAPIEPMAHALFSHWYKKKTDERGAAPRKIGAVVLNVAPAKTYLRELKGVICPKLGCSVVREQLVNYSDTEYATICRNMQNERVDTVFIVTDPASAVKLLVQCREVNYVPPAGWLGQHGIYMDLTLDQSGPIADGTYANGAVLPDSVDAPANREMKRIVATYYPEADFGYFSSLGYASARMVEDLIREAFKAGGALTRSGFLSAASRITSYDCHGLCKDVNLRPPPRTHGGNHNVWIVRASRGRWVMAAGPIDAWRTSTWPRPGRP